MTLRRAITNDPEKAPDTFSLRLRDAAPEPHASIEAWLAVFVRLLHLSEAKRTAIRDELREHLIERVRDLELAGRSEPDAIGAALAELGETAALANRFDTANRPHRRRLVMNVLLIGAGAGAVFAGVMTFTPNRSEVVQSARFEAAAQEAPKSLADARFTLAEDVGLRDALQSISKQSELGLKADWGTMEEVGVDHAEPLGLSFREMPGPQALNLIAEVASRDSARLDWRLREGNLIEFGTGERLDRADVALVNYNIASIIQAMQATYNRPYENAVADIVGLLTSMVSPDDWRENGGHLAHQTVVAGRLFVEAPPRMHEKVEWMLSELGKDVEGRAAVDLIAPEASAKRSPGLAPGDVVTVEVFELFKPGEWYRATRLVEPDGLVRLPLVGGVEASGLTTSELEDQVRAEVAKLVADPTVAVHRTVLASQAADEAAAPQPPPLAQLIALHPPLGTAFERLGQARIDFDLVNARYQPSGIVYVEKERALAEAQRAYDVEYQAAIAAWASEGAAPVR